MANLFNPAYTPTIKFNSDQPTQTEALQYFAKFLKNFSYFKRADIQNLDVYWEYGMLPKLHILIEPNHVANYIYFIVKGAVKYYLQDEDRKYITAFFTECNFCAPVIDFYSQQKTKNGAMGVEDLYFLRISFEKYQQLIHDRPVFENIFKLLAHQTASLLKDRLKAFQSLDAPERYHQLMHDNSEVFNRFMMQDISNYLGITPETLSRLRSERSRKAH